MTKKNFSSFLYNHGDRITLLKRVLAYLGHPDQNFSIIHICGTNGKGSTSMMIAACLENLDQRVGLFTSPAIGQQTNCIQVNGVEISKGHLNDLFMKLKQVMAISEFHDAELSDFEALFLASMLYFSEEGADYVVLECGLGGELDATNAVTTTLYSIFTEIGLDHLGVLGNSLEEIVTTKSKIIRPANTTIIAPQHSQIINGIIKREATIKGARLIDAAKTVIIHSQNIGQQLMVDYQTSQQHGQFQFGLLANYQLENVRTVIAWLIDFCQSKHLTNQISDLLNHALATINVPGRFETVNKKPMIIVDGGHNLDGITAFANTVNTIFPHYNKLIVTGFLKDKDYQDSVHKLLGIKQAHFIITEPDNVDRRLAARQLQQAFIDASGITYPVFKRPITAIKAAINAANRQSKLLIFVVGSFYLLNPIRTYLINKEDKYNGDTK
ncbi:bifunctional folylpolyglutamate synthase/dihydrofolate synthase [Lentilactobacillus kisonensis]|uniref:tetrahydrofolate synthase n=2 Tax=Lentilactobacillus kisonensis TaxID=481722 RepID=H1LG98_9LACO|nr:Mur ligase family protein [Lentilactobacillus kisonensis]EHO51110.1 protein FolC [Lentilactobacillus kisonensis F0435]KRL23425.1 protein FolC [Lentilactobacillus kisonensis DSM 19906 = JCM 15041]